MATYNDILIDGNQDVKLLRVQANTTQTQPLQTWENSDGSSVLAQVSKDGYVQLGDDLLGWSTPDALIEAHRAETSTTKPKRGFHSLGRVTNLISDAINWAVTELELLGTAGVSGVQMAFRAKITHDNSGGSTNATLRAGDFESINQTGSSGARVGQVTGVRGTASNVPSGANAYLAKAVGVEGSVANAQGGDITAAAAFEVAAPSNSGTIATLYGLRIPALTQGNTNYAIYTDTGTVRLGDAIEMTEKSSTPPTPPSGSRKLYPKSDGWYDLNSAGQATKIGSGTGGSAPTGAMLMWPTDTAPADWLLCYGQAISRTTYAALFGVIGTTFGAGDGSTTFNLPDMRGRFPLGRDDMGGTSANRVTATAADSIGGSSGLEDHTLTTAQLPAHKHAENYDSGSSQAPAYRWNGGTSRTSIIGTGGYTGDGTRLNTDNTGSGNAHNNMPPYLTLNYIIKA
jgi:microcystin-dependent protein